MKFKNAFTIVEILIAIAIIAIISSYAVYTVQKYDKGIRFLYSNTYHNVDRALYNAFNFANLDNPFATSELKEDGTEVVVTPEEGAKRLCEMLVSYLNTSVAACSAGGLANPDGTSLGSVKFTTLNGVDFYITPRLPEENNPRTKEGDHAFFIIFADINGSERPNSLDYEPPTEDNGYKTKDPDRFAFAALDTGRVCPLGPPEVDPRYMQARIAYVSVMGEADENKDTGDKLITRYSVTSRPYYQAKAEAWGYYLAGDDDADRNPIDDEPMSYNDYVRYILPPETKIYKFLDGASLVPPEGVHLESGAVKDGGYGCREHSGEECWVIVDKYVF